MNKICKECNERRFVNFVVEGMRVGGCHWCDTYNAPTFEAKSYCPKMQRLPSTPSTAYTTQRVFTDTNIAV